MTVFAAMFDTLFGDPNMAVDAVYRAGGTGSPVAVRAMAARQDEIAVFGETRIRNPVSRFDIRVAEIAAPAEGDTLQIGAETFRIQGAPVLDRDRLLWRLDCAKTV